MHAAAIGVDVVSGLVHSLVTTPAHVHDLTPVPELLHGCERLVWGDAGYQGVHKRSEHQERALARRPAAGGNDSRKSSLQSGACFAA